MGTFVAWPVVHAGGVEKENSHCHVHRFDTPFVNSAAVKKYILCIYIYMFQKIYTTSRQSCVS